MNRSRVPTPSRSSSSENDNDLGNSIWTTAPENTFGMAKSKSASACGSDIFFLNVGRINETGRAAFIRKTAEKQERSEAAGYLFARPQDH
jgi:hypothetical protein